MTVEVSIDRSESNASDEHASDVSDDVDVVVVVVDVELVQLVSSPSSDVTAASRP